MEKVQDFMRLVSNLSTAYGIKSFFVVVHAEKGGAVAIGKNIPDSEEAMARLSLNLSDGMKHDPRINAIIEAAYNMNEIVKQAEKEGGKDGK